MPISDLVTDEFTVQTPTERRSRFWSFEAWDFTWTIAFGTLAALFSLQVGLTFGTLVFLTLVIVWWFSMTTPKKGRFNDRRFTLPIWWLVEFRLIIAKGVIWQAAPTLTGTTSKAVKAKPADPAKKRKDRSTRRQVVRPFPLEAKAFVDAKTQQSIGLIYHQGKQTYSMVFKAPGSDIMSRSKADQYATLTQIAEVLKKAALTAGLGGIGIGIGMNSRPQDPWKTPRIMLNTCSVRTLAPSALATGKPESEYTPDDKMDVALNSLQAELPHITVQSYEVNMMVVVTMSATGALRPTNSKNDIDQREFRRLPIIRVRDMMLPLLQRSIGEHIDVLDLEGVERYLRMARDAVTLGDYYNEYQERWLDEQIADQMAKQSGEKVTLPSPMYDRYLPTRNITVGKDFTNVDGTWFSVLEMTTFPTSRITPAGGASLYQSGTPWMSMAVVGRGVNSRLEYEATNQAQMTGRDALDILGYRGSGARADRKEQEKYDRSAEIDNAGVTMDYIIRFATLAPTRELLESETDDEETRFAGFGPLRLSNRAQQWRKLLTTLTLIDCD